MKRHRGFCGRTMKGFSGSSTVHGSEGCLSASPGVVLLLSVVAFFFFAASSYSGEAALTGEAEKCLSCHGKKGIVKNFQNEEKVDAYVSPEKFRKSAHGEMGCTACHGEFSSATHPARLFRSMQQYRVRSTAVCRRCHTKEKLKTKPVHEGLFKGEREGVAPVCSDCHDPHAAMPVRGGKIMASETQYCLNCHKYTLSMTFKSGENMSLHVDPVLLKSSVHHDLSCSDCHFGFSSLEHPERNFRTKRIFTIATSENCRRCHFDKYAKTMESAHYTLLSQGNLDAPVCTDCHSSHSIQAGRVEKVLSGKRCQKCHNDIFSIYASSVHGKALIDEHNQDVPICVDCHRAHDIGNPLTLEYQERIPEMCGGCHGNKEIMSKYGLSTNVVKTYLSDFHGVTLGFYRKEKERPLSAGRPIAVCTDCHGTHNISRTMGPNANVIKANLVKKCRKCHPGADENFPSTWLSHYEPSLHKSTLLYLVNTSYDIFMPVLLAGLLLQILLHIWRYAINR